MDLLVLVFADPDHQFQHQTHAAREYFHHMYHAHHLVHHLQHHLQLVVELELQQLGLNQLMALAKKHAPLSSQYPQLFDLQQTQYHGLSEPSLQLDQIVCIQTHPIHGQEKYIVVSYHQVSIFILRKMNRDLAPKHF